MPEGACLQLPGYVERAIHESATEDKPLPHVSGEIVLEDDHNQYMPMPTDGRSNVPLVRLAPPEDPEDLDEDFFYEEESMISPWQPALDRISEVTEPTESRRSRSTRSSMRQPSFNVRQSVARRSSQTSTTDYGQVLGKQPSSSYHCLSDTVAERQVLRDPNEMRPSPSDSALQRLSLSEPPPTASPSGSRTPTQDAVQLPPPVSPISAAPPTVPSKTSLSSLARKAREAQLTPAQAIANAYTQATNAKAQSPSSEPKKPKSKLSALASSRASLSSKSTTSYSETVDSGSVLTYPPLRPTTESVVSFSPTETSATGDSSMSSHVRRAIQTAIDLEAIGTSAPSVPDPTTVSSIPPTPAPKSPVPVPSSPPAAPSPVLTAPVLPATATPPSRATEPKSRPTSKLAQLAQAKAQQSQQSPLAMKAKQMRSEGPGLAVHKSHTEYLVPIVNGPTATTAITTTYQTLGSLAQHKRSSSSTTQGVEMYASKASRDAAEPRQSKLAMKSRRAPKTELEPDDEPVLAALDLPMFSSDAPRTRALPSAFAALLIDDEAPPRGKSAGSKDKKESTLTQEHRTIVEKPRKRTHKRHEVPPPPTSTTSSQGFAFDVPSPDDVVFNARRGTSLGGRSLSASTHPQSTASSGGSAASRSTSTTPLPIRTSVRLS